MKRTILLNVQQVKVDGVVCPDDRSILHRHLLLLHDHLREIGFICMLAMLTNNMPFTVIFIKTIYNCLCLPICLI